jgi:amidase
MPLGTQFIAPFGDETTLFQLAGQLERTLPWFDRRPQLTS